MRHEAGVGCLDDIITLAQVQDPEQLSALLASQPHNFNGNLQRSYHGVTGGWYVNEILKRTANCTVDQVAASYMNDYGIEWHLKPHEPEFDNRITRYHLLPRHYEIYNMIRGGVGFARYMWAIIKDKTKVMSKTIGMPGPDAVGPEHITDKKYRQIEMPSISGYTNARSVSVCLCVFDTCTMLSLTLLFYKDCKTCSNDGQWWQGNRIRRTGFTFYRCLCVSD